MKKILLVLFLLFLTARSFGQQFSLLHTGTLYDSFENPSERAFIPDTEKKYASNFLIPNFNADLTLSGDAQATLKSRIFDNVYNNSLLELGKEKNNYATENINVYILMFKVFQSFNGDQEIGISWQLKTDGKASFSDETAAALNGPGGFNSGQEYTNILNDRYYYQTYHQISFTYHEKINKQLSIGVKLSALLGVEYQKLNIYGSNVTFDGAADTARASLQGKYYAGYVPGQFTAHDYLPTLRSPGAAITVGGTYTTEDKVIIQGTIKDLGFIHWDSRSTVYDFDGTTTVSGLNLPSREDSIYNKVKGVIHENGVGGSFATPIDGRAELSVHKKFYIDDDQQFSYSPSLVASKELFYQGFEAALVNPIQYQKYVFSLTPMYDNMKQFSLGAMFLVKAFDWEFYIGSDRLAQTVSTASEALSKNSPSTLQNSGYTGASIFLGFSLKLGPVIEHPMNSSTMPMGEKGFLGRLWGRLFKTNYE